ncbi:ribonuclease Z [Nanoarchaeota archaeon]
MQLTFLGTGSMVPTKDRNVVGHFLEYNGDGILIDCGEGTQRQMNIAGINRLRVNKILITHWHGDHVAGLVGLLQTISNSENPGKIKLFGPVGSQASVDMFMQATLHANSMDVEVTELNPEGLEKFHETEDYYIECAPLDHSAPVLGYSFVEKDKRKIIMSKVEKLGMKQGPLLGKLQKGEEVTFKGKKVKPDDVSKIQKGKKVTFVLDTTLCEGCIRLAENADYLICEATYASDLEGKALEYKHLTAGQAALIASKADAKKLILTHFSQRYANIDKLLKDAQMIFPETSAANDFMRVKFK